MMRSLWEVMIYMSEKSLTDSQKNYLEAKEKIKAVCESSGRENNVRLMAVTKTVPPEKVNEVIEAGCDLLGENRVQELLEKYESYDKRAEIHFIGRLQTNKVKYIAGKVSLIQSVDSEHLMAEIDRQAKKLGIVQDILAEVNIGGEEAKSGVAPELLPELLDAAAKYGSVRIRGLMAVAPKDDGFGLAGRCFSQMYKLFIDNQVIKRDNIVMDYLSMGMSGDYEAAIKEGSNMIRLGTSIFGPRI